MQWDKTKELDTHFITNMYIFGLPILKSWLRPCFLQYQVQTKLISTNAFQNNVLEQYLSEFLCIKNCELFPISATSTILQNCLYIQYSKTFWKVLNIEDDKLQYFFHIFHNKVTAER